MLGLLALGLGIGAGVQAWRGWPPTSPATPESLWLVFAVGLVAAYYAGRRRRGGTAVATAVASASASNSVQVAVIVPGQGASTSHLGASVPTASAPWLESTSTVPELTADSLEGMDLSDVVQDVEWEQTSG